MVKRNYSQILIERRTINTEGQGAFEISENVINDLTTLLTSMLRTS